MKESEESEVDIADTDAIRVGEDGKPRVDMETLQKHGEKNPSSQSFVDCIKSFFRCLW
ncbi:hypothetical protein [Halorientalis persicus]|uniref:hypothetical protein n=1 Tax=Halorientalis persicus TaxID=1367881 RepID=UPI00148032C3|nr:hypothetical protein [Halorientalis persicus]